MANRKKWAIGYAVFCMLYFAVSVLLPHDKLDPRGLEGIGKPSLKLKTEEITNDTELKFEYYADEQALNQISFYFTDNEHEFTQGEILIEAYDSQTGELLASQSHELLNLKVEAFLGVAFEKEPRGRTLDIVITGKDLKEGPAIWLNTESRTQVNTYENGQFLENNLIYNSIYRIQIHYIKNPLLTTLMLLILGGMVFLVSEKKPDFSKKTGTSWGSKRGTLRKRFGTFYQKYRLWIGMGFLLFLVGLIFFYVYDGQIRKAMNSTHRVVVMRDNNKLLPVTEKSREMVQYYTTEEDTLVGLGVRMDLGEEFVPAGSIHAQVKDITLE